MRAALGLVLCLMMAACTTVTKPIASASKEVFGTGTDGQPLLASERTFQLTPSLAISLEKIIYWGAYAGVAYLVLDPLAPNWEIEQAQLDPNHVHFSLKMKRYYSGGAGEARQVFQQRAKTLVREGNFASYEILEYSESLESSVLGSQRVGQGVIRLIPKA